MTETENLFSEELQAYLNDAGTEIIPGAALSHFTTFRIGGPCPALVNCHDAKSFLLSWEVLIKSGHQPLLIGGGSNLLVSDAGISNVVVRYVEDDLVLVREDGLFRVSAGVMLDDLARITAESGLDGLVSCSGIPGTVGGAIAGNAGAFGEQIGDRVAYLEVLDRSGHFQIRKPNELGFAYRASNIPASGDVVVSALLQLDEAPPSPLLTRRAEILELRKIKHPDWGTIPTAGSFFKNIEPTSKAERRQAAGWFLEQSGALNMRVGGARTFEKHANIIIAEPGCRADDVAALSRKMADAVLQKFGIALEREVKMIGDF
ncbi:MAG TPA: UDP-N-acetylmuramate dehydrogenase [Kiritimatiellia bacterium]|nr:UDP-N-acetylmuramate dehydrogenase [Kiritimatiellia bacterium]